MLCIAQTLYGAAKNADGTSSTQEMTYAAMPAGYEIAPDDISGIARYVIAPYNWDIYRVCTRDTCYGTRYYGEDAGSVKDSARKWETNGAGAYRIKSGEANWYRLLIRKACAPDSAARPPPSPPSPGPLTAPITCLSDATHVTFVGYTYKVRSHAASLEDVRAPAHCPGHALNMPLDGGRVCCASRRRSMAPRRMRMVPPARRR